MMQDEAGGHPRDLLSPYLDGEIDPDGRVEVDRHLERCAACRALLDDMRLLSAGIAAEEPPPAPADLAARIGRHIDGIAAAPKVVPMRRVAWRSPLMLGSMAAVVAGVMATIVWYTARPPVVSRETIAGRTATPAPPDSPGPKPAAALDESRAMRAQGGEGAGGENADRPERKIAGREKGNAGEPAPVPLPPAARDTMARMDQEAARPAPSIQGASSVRPSGAAGGMKEEIEPDEAAGQPAQPLAAPASEGNARADLADPDRRAGPVQKKEDAGGGGQPESKDASAPADLGDLARMTSAPGVAPPARSLELSTGRYRAVLSEQGSLDLAAGSYRCIVQGAPGQAVPPERAGSAGVEAEIREIFALAAAAEERRADAGKAQGAAAPLEAGAQPAPGVVVLYRTSLLSGREEVAAAAPIAARLDRLIRDHYLPIAEQECGPLPPDLQEGR
jgi:hypothetical protein